MVLGVASEPAEEVGALGEDGGYVRVRVPGGISAVVGEVVTEE